MPQNIASAAYHVTLTDCSKKFQTYFHDDIAVLKHSIETNSYPVHPRSKYKAKFYGIVSPHLNNTECVKILRAENFTVRLLELPATEESMKPHIYEAMRKDGCCGPAELMKLYTYTIDPNLHPVSVSLDLDTLLLKPFDTLFDTILYNHDTPEGRIARERLISEGYIAPTYIHQHQDVSNETILRQTFHAFYTKEYNAAVANGWQAKRVPLQGGFLMVKPNKTVFDELIQIVNDGDFIMGRGIDKGWRGSGYGRHIYGSMTIQGLLAYYYNEHWQTSVELNRCRVNQKGDNPRHTTAHQRITRPTLLHPNISLWEDTICRDERDNCDDTQCQNWPITETTLVHFTSCRRQFHTPRKCKVRDVSQYEYLWEYACYDMFREWFRTRHSLEVHRGMDVPLEKHSSYFFNITFGYCEDPETYVSMKW